VCSSDLWGVDGIKEDTMMRLGDHTEIFNQPIARISESGGLVMARCGSFSSPGTLQRVEDTNGVKSMSNRTPINYLQYAASGAPNVYSDTMGFRTMKSYSDAVIRHGWLLATTAGMSVGETPFHWTETEQALFKKPVDFHYRLGPYLYDAAVKSWQTGYPHTMTPLGIAFPDDADAMATPHFQWMIGESILAVPLLRNPEQNLLDIYLPAGLWFDYDTGERFEGPRLLREVDMPPRKTPCFVGGKGIVVERVGDEAPLRARIYPVSRHGTDTFTFHHPDGKNPSTLTLSGNGTVTRVQEVASGRAVDFQWERNAAIAVFDLLPGVSYRIVFEVE
jgi:alpha-glucosidase (family GH31 glycosyl hydrolase)